MAKAKKDIGTVFSGADGSDQADPLLNPDGSPIPREDDTTMQREEVPPVVKLVDLGLDEGEVSDETSEDVPIGKEGFLSYLKVPTEELSAIDKAINDQFMASTLHPDKTIIRNSEAKITPKNVNAIVRTIASSYDCGTRAAISGIQLLFLKGAANKGAPDSLSVEVFDEKNERVKITKGDLFAAYKSECRNPHLRRLAEYLASVISEFGYKNGIAGDILSKINPLLNKDEEPLTNAEKSWASSFNQKNNDCALRFPRLFSLLQLEYRLKFQKPQQTNKNNQTPKQPRKPGPGKGKGGSKQKNKKN